MVEFRLSIGSRGLKQPEANLSRPGVQDNPRLGVDIDNIFGPIRDECLQSVFIVGERNLRCRHHGKFGS